MVLGLGLSPPEPGADSPILTPHSSTHTVHSSPASHKVVPHRRLLIHAVGSDIFGADQNMVRQLDAQALDWNSGFQWAGVLAGTARQLIGADLQRLRDPDL